MNSVYGYRFLFVHPELHVGTLTSASGFRVFWLISLLRSETWFISGLTEVGASASRLPTLIPISGPLHSEELQRSLHFRAG